MNGSLPFDSFISGRLHFIAPKVSLLGVCVLLHARFFNIVSTYLAVAKEI